MPISSSEIYLVMYWVVRKCTIECLLYLHSHIDTICVDDAISDVAVERGNMEIIEYLHSLGYRFGLREIINASSCGHLPCIKYLAQFEDDDFMLTHADKLIRTAAYSGHLDIVEYMFDAASLDACRIAFDNAQKNNHIDIVDFFTGAGI